MVSSIDTWKGGLNKMATEGLSRLSKKCRVCPFVDKCDHKEMEALAYLSEPIITARAESTQQVLRQTVSPIVDKNFHTLIKRLSDELSIRPILGQAQRKREKGL